MSWHQVIIRNSDVADLSATALMNGFMASYHKAGCPDGVKVYHGRNDVGDHIYFFSPAASAAALNVLGEFSATACSEPQRLAALRKIKL